jgi:FkbM family methyltransferase
MEWHHYIRPKRLAWWESQIGKRQYVETRIQPGVRMRLYFDNRLSTAIYCGDFEWRERQFLNAFLRPGDVFVDIGAHIGLFTLIAARRVGNTGRVYAFEPCSETYQRLLANVELNRLTNVSCYQLALSDRATQLDMTTSLDGYDAWNSLTRPIMGNSFAVETVNAVRWDDFVQERNLIGHVTMMKIDVEGWESYVLSGGYQVLSRTDAPVLQVEFTEQASQVAGSSCAKLYHLLEELGYQMFVYNAMSKRLIRDPLRASYPYLNLIAAKKPAEVFARLERRSGLHWFWNRTS